MLQLARQVEVVRAPRAYSDAYARAIDLGVVMNRRSIGHEISAFNDHVGRRKADERRAQRIDREKTDIPDTRLEPFDDLASSIVGHVFDRDTEPSCQLAREFDRYPARFAGGVLRSEIVLSKDRGSQRAGRGDIGFGGRNHGGHRRIIPLTVE
jgi:hypothetical protein